MTCEQYRILLEKYLDGSLTAGEDMQLHAHEADCPACAAQRLALDGLQDDLASLKDDVPPMPADFHQGWMTRVEEEAMTSRERKPRPRFHWNRMLSTAAALVFVLGGTLLTRDRFSPAPASTDRTSSASIYGTYDAAYQETGGADSMIMTAKYNLAAPTVENSAAMDMDMGASMKRSMPAAGSEEHAESARTPKIIRTASMTIGTQAYDETLASLRALCEGSGGWIAYSSEDVLYSGKRQAYLSLRIPTEQLDACLSGAGSLGRVTSKYESSTDVSESYNDTQARLDTQLALMDRLKALMTDAASLSDLLALETQIADTQYQIDSLQSSLNSTDRQVEYATLDVTLREESSADAITDHEQTLLERLSSALETGLHAFGAFMLDMLVFLTAALPFLLVVGVVWIVWKMIRRKKK